MPFAWSEDWIRSAELTRSAQAWINLQTRENWGSLKRRRFQRTPGSGTFPMVLRAAQEEKEEDTNFRLTDSVKCSTSPITVTARWETFHVQLWRKSSAKQSMASFCKATCSLNWNSDICLCFDPIILLLGIYPKKMIKSTDKDLYAKMFIKGEKWRK